ncbi:MAG: response regulator transcription factor [Ignavibacteriales bacterium]|nr:response regulator transcription factor [Ignavibacteriales bacterium]
MDKKKILLVEDDGNLGTILNEYLNVKGFDVTHSVNGEEGLYAFHSKQFDICIVDVMMPRMDGFTLAKKIRAAGAVPIIFLTAKSMANDKIEGFQIGADDYVTKPFSMEELVLRINAILKRTSKHSEEINRNGCVIGEYIFNYEKRLLTFKEKVQKLTTREAELLKLLCENKNNLLERSNALIKIWKNESYFTSRSMDVYIAKLRGYLKNDPSIQIINVHGTGFKLMSE